MTYKDETPKPYAFEYGVHDDYAGTNFAQNENADGSTASGSYSVLLPDGRTQTVTYHADQVRPYFIISFNFYSFNATTPRFKMEIELCKKFCFLGWLWWLRGRCEIRGSRSVP